MAWKVLQYFEDLQDRGHSYRAGDSFPRSGLEVSPQRIAELSGTSNRRGEPLIENDGDPEAPPAEKKAGGRKRKAE